MQAIDRNFKSSFEHASFIAEKGEYGKCISYINQELKLMEKDTQNLYHGRSLYLFAKCKIMIYDYDKVDIILDNSIKILANNDDHYFLSNAYFYKFNISFNNDKFNKAEIYIRKSIEEFKKSYIGDPSLETKLFFSLGFTLYKQNKYKEAIINLNHAIELSYEKAYKYSEKSKEFLKLSFSDKQASENLD